jgi:hypothetical protein
MTGTSNMSMLTPGLERSFRPARAQDARPAGLSREQKAKLKRIGLRALALLSMGSVLTALIALKTAIFMWRFH